MTGWHPNHLNEVTIIGYIGTNVAIMIAAHNVTALQDILFYSYRHALYNQPRFTYKDNFTQYSKERKRLVIMLIFLLFTRFINPIEQSMITPRNKRHVLF